MNIRKTIYSIGFLTATAVIAGCSSSDKPTYLEPHLNTLAATDITRTEATLHGNITIEGDAEMPRLWFRYGTTEQMLSTTKELTTADDSSMSLMLTGLTAGTTYYYMLEGSNGYTTTTGNTESFTTLPNVNPSLQPLTMLSHGPTSAIVSYEITDDGGEPMTEAGCYVYPVESPDEKQKCIIDDFDGSIGMKKLRIGNLQRNKSYLIMPFAKNTIGETIGEAISYTTSDAVVLNESGELATLMGDNLYEYTSLSLSGPVNGDDLSCLRLMMGRDQEGMPTPGKLTEIDMTDAKIVAGGGAYGSSRYTQDNVIGQGLFANCENITEVKLPADATTLEKDAFQDCTSLRKIEIAAGITSLFPSSGCTGLEEISVSSANAIYSSKDGVLLNSDGTAIVWFPMGKTGEYSLPSSIISIGDYAFKECNIETFNFPDGLKDIGQGAFMNSKVKEVKLPDVLKQIPTGTFQNCTQLEVVRLGSKTELITDYAFDQCPLTDLYVTSKYPPVCEENAFSYSKGTGFTDTCILHVPTGKKKLYHNHNRWKVFTNITEE